MNRGPAAAAWDDAAGGPGLPLDGDEDGSEPDALLTPRRHAAAAASPSPPLSPWQVTWSLTETDASSAGAASSALSSSMSSDGESCSLTAPPPGSPPRFPAPRGFGATSGSARRRVLPDGSDDAVEEEEEELSDISEELGPGLGLDPRVRRRRRARPRRRLSWLTPFRGLVLLFCATAYTIFGIPEDDLAGDIVMMGSDNSSAAADLPGPRLRSQAAAPPHHHHHPLLHAVAAPGPHLTFRQREEVARFYHQPALRRAAGAGTAAADLRAYYGAALLGVALWAVRFQLQLRRRNHHRQQQQQQQQHHLHRQPWLWQPQPSPLLVTPVGRVHSFRRMATR